MKRFWLVLLSLGLVLAFSASAMAVDVKFSGSFYAAGMYLDKTTVVKGVGSNQDISTAFYYQRLRLQTDFIVSPGLKLVTRFDALERIWGGKRSDVPIYPTAEIPNAAPLDAGSAATRAESENIAFDWAYISYTSPIGLFEVGYMADNGWGTVFGNNAINGPSVGAISYTIPIGPVYINAKISKGADYSRSAVNYTENTTDRDDDSYSVCAIYVPNKDIQAGLLFGYKRVAGTRLVGGDMSGADFSYVYPFSGLATAYSVNPYFKAKFGPVALEGEVNYVWGTLNYESTFAPWGIVPGGKGDISNLTVYLNALADFSMFYGGATFAYVSGNDDTTPSSKWEGGFIDGGVDFQPCLIMFNSDRKYWVGSLSGNGGALSNAWFGQGKIGVRPVAALDITASVAYAAADKKNAVLSDAYGWEIDVTGTYKLTNNLSYMLGGAYWFTGDYYKGTNVATSLQNDFLLINKLTLTF